VNDICTGTRATWDARRRRGGRGGRDPPRDTPSDVRVRRRERGDCCARPSAGLGPTALGI